MGDTCPPYDPLVRADDLEWGEDVYSSECWCGALGNEVHATDCTLDAARTDEGLRALWAEPHHLGFPVSGRTGTYDPDMVMVKRDWYDRLGAALASPPAHKVPMTGVWDAAANNYRCGICRARITRTAPPDYWKHDPPLASPPAPAGDMPDSLSVDGHMFVHVAACPCPRIQAEVQRLAAAAGERDDG